MSCPPLQDKQEVRVSRHSGAGSRLGQDPLIGVISQNRLIRQGFFEKTLRVRNFKLIILGQIKASGNTYGSVKSGV